MSYHFEPFLALEASAGSGKTFALSVRFVALVLMGAKINEILALTFTNKATSEMKERVFKTFLEFDVLENGENKAECNELMKMLGKSKNELIALREKYKDEFLRSKLNIYTFDSFFSQIMRSFALNLGLMSDFDIIENQDSYKNFISKLDEEELRALAYYIVQTKSKSDFLQNLESLYERSCEINSIQNAHFPNKTFLEKSLSEFITYARNLSTDKNYQKNFEFENIEDFFTKPIICDLDKKYFVKVIDSEFLQKRAEFLQSAKEYFTQMENYRISMLAKLLKHFKEARNENNAKQNALTFSDIALKTYELISDETNKDLIYFRLDGYISHLLIDEFQDTNVLQYQILKPIIAELVSGEGVKKNRSFFYVGDKKQSIYGFRGGKKELFDKLLKDFPQIKLEHLDTNYRSKKIIVDYVNEVFKNKFFDSFLNPSFTWQKSIKEGGYVEVLQNHIPPKSSLHEASGKEVLKIIQKLLEKGVKLSEICILVWINKDATLMKEFLEENNIKAYTQSNVALIDCISARVLFEYAKACVLKDEFGLYFASSILEKELEFITLDLNHSVGEILKYLVHVLKLDLSDVNLIAYLEYASTFDNFFDFLFAPCELKSLQAQDDGVSIMTVHKSKGLEFENLIVLDRLSKKAPDNETLMFEYDLEQGWEVKYRHSARKYLEDQNYNAFLAKREKLQAEDEINCLYVALTRAKNSLFIIKNDESFKTFKSYFQDYEEKQIGIIEEQLVKTNEPLENLEQIENFEEFQKVNLQEVKVKSYLSSTQIHFGLALHEFLQYFDFNTKSNFEFCKQMVYKKYRFYLDDESFNELFKRLTMLLKDESFNALLAGKKLLKEQIITYKGEQKQLDMLAFDDNEAIIIDYKTGLNLNEHKKQVLLYKEAIEKILAKTSTKAFLVYILKNKVEVIYV
ncbi:RecB-like helicase [Campylobacter lari]|uniref:DNA 3'-5' helicase n=1 Tax=Campylobacter lari TaxID=201 RepID=A0A5L4NM30_CAMLA|nr:RecB-like helicase [Campylobacter sp. CNRCH_2013_0898h]EAI3905401.1 RecB-like helicase [Campylobacter lari]EAI3913793.1 RecB-like helicase [Campylobacter lari]EAI4447579.1 RecB-like helicase [Campylobacter lari]EAI4449623.1 RecB-like helicase [Campylobacter lari]EAJ6187936.1 RecB-like helicase [Campylobacter lari]